MRIVSLIPYWKDYSFQNKALNELETIPLSGKAFINYPIVLANKINQINQTYIFTNDCNISNKIDGQLHYEILPRNRDLDNQEASIEDIISDFLSRVECDFILLLHPNSPFLKPETLEDCLEKVLRGDFDSSFLATVEKKFVWYRGERLNYHPKAGTPHLSEIEPVVIESNAAYFFSRDTFKKFGTRIGVSPFIKEVGYFEGMTMNTFEQIKLAEFILDSGFTVAE